MHNRPFKLSMTPLHSMCFVGMTTGRHSLVGSLHILCCTGAMQLDRTGTQVVCLRGLLFLQGHACTIISARP